MAYRDTWATCEQCGKQFVFGVEEQRRQAEQGQEITPPRLCPQHRGEAAPRREERPERRDRAQPAQRPVKDRSEPLGYGPHEGRVKWYSKEKGYGFIVHSGGEQVFFHHSGIKNLGEEFPEDAPVTFLVEETEKGPQAVEVERMDLDD